MGSDVAMTTDAADKPKLLLHKLDDRSKESLSSNAPATHCLIWSNDKLVIVTPGLMATGNSPEQ